MWDATLHLRPGSARPAHLLQFATPQDGEYHGTAEVQGLLAHPWADAGTISYHLTHLPWSAQPRMHTAQQKHRSEVAGTKGKDLKKNIFP